MKSHCAALNVTWSCISTGNNMSLTHITRLADKENFELIRTLRKENGKSINETARLAGVSRMTVIRACKD